ncbi:MAG: hypothetical protein A3J28_10570 [Acidobacteria bacterium RIFCSPLOWO2_12_FULL_60_22]|nr:MAG: hypothetical protein A3J28_10570 [Acidobacteria bacterium RIFCSPLOWO2_12_FULL_60_22]
MRARLRTVILLALATSAGLWAADDIRIGTWKLDVAKSKYSPGPPPKSSIVRFEPYGENGVKVTVETVGAQGGKTKHQYSANYDGKDVPVTGDPNRDTVALKRIDAYTLEYTNKKGGKVIGAYKEVVAKDGKSRTVTQQGTNPQGQPVDNVLVYDRQ